MIARLKTVFRNSVLSALLAVLVAVPAADAGRAAQKITLHPGESVAVSGTRMVCQYGGPARETAVSCGIAGALPGFIPGTSGFSMNEKEALAFDVKTSGSSSKPTKIVKPAVTYKELFPAHQPTYLPAALTFKSVGTIVPGDMVLLQDMDITCFPYLPKGASKIRVGCALVDKNNYYVINSYAGSLNDVDTEIVKFDSNRLGKSLFVRNQPCLPRTKNLPAFTKRTLGAINGLGKLGVRSQPPLKKAAALVRLEDFSGAAAALKQIKVARLPLPNKKKALLKKQITTLVLALAPKCR